METTGKEKIENITDERKEAHRFYNEHSKVYRKFVELEKLAFKDGALVKKHKELIALGISICRYVLS